MTNNDLRTSIKMSIRVKLITISLLLLVVPLSVLGITSYNVSKKETESLIQSNLSTSVHMAIEIIEKLNESVQNNMMSKEAAQEQVKQMILGEKANDGTRPLNSAIDFGENGYFFIIDEKGTLLAHPFSEGQNIFNNKASDGTFYIQELIQAATQGGGFVEYPYPLPNKNDNSAYLETSANQKETSSKEAVKLSYAKVVPEWDWIVSAGFYKQDYNSGQTNILKSIVLILVICTVIGSILLLLFARHLINPIIKIKREAEQIAAGNLSGQPLIIRNRDEIGQLGVSFNTLKENLQHLIGNLSLSSHTLAASSNQLSVVTEETIQAINHTTNAITEVANNNEMQAKSTQETATAMDEMAIGIGRVADASSRAYELSSTTLDQAKDGNERTIAATNQVQVLSGTVQELSVSIALLMKQSAQIEDIVNVIKSISSQTNLLALNAAIEASRAGEHGRGFAVVAGEVRKLAEMTNQSAEQITELVDNIRGNVFTTSATMKKSEHEFSNAILAIQESSRRFDTIVDSTQSVVDQIQDVSAAAQQMSASSEEISAAIHEIEHISLRTAGAAQNVSAAAEEQLASMDEIASSIEKLKSMSTNMEEQSDKFKL
ncbi:methyl-accepting chemotaxis protein [Paenibacillus yanchengensis]|uniref:Methyl-accepting chemotaxis protein n=1 Tax=Paenibacillus yanchengensis TaxID=2035833 RepID=A0ABW4YI76_9BACL